MTTETGPKRRTDALTKERIIDAAIEILDREGETALTFRALASHLATGSGALYWHVANKSDLLAAATDRIIARALADAAGEPNPRDAIRALAMGVFDAIHTHPWVGGQLSRDPWQYAALRILEGVGGRIQALGVPEAAQFNAATALMSFILGLAGQYATRPRRREHGKSRAEILGAVAEKWARLDPTEHPFVRQIAAVLPGHDDREQFLAGIDLILVGVERLR